VADFEPLIEMREIGDLRCSKRNARTHSTQQVKQLAASIREFGFTNPVLISDDCEIVAGHGRVEAAKQLAIKRVPVIRLSHMTPLQRRAYMIADNKLALNAGWDKELLALELTEIAALDFDLPVLGFSLPEIDLILDDACEASVDGADDKDDIIPDPLAEPITKPGDIWRLGRHRLICGDARDPDVYHRLLGDELVDLIFADPPYNVPIDGHVCGSGAIRHREFAMASGEMSESEFTQFLIETMGSAAKRCRDGAIAYVCMDWRHIQELAEAGKQVFSELKNLCVWNKKNAGMGTFYRSKHELVFVFKVGSAPHINNFGLGDGGRYRSNVWDYAGITSIGAKRQAELKMHPTVKPVAMIADALRDCSHRGDIVLDNFGGSGSTAIAAEKCGRIARLIEFDPAYCDTIVRRFETFSGKVAKVITLF
jgi:DNA modification methylase